MSWNEARERERVTEGERGRARKKPGAILAPRSSTTRTHARTHACRPAGRLVTSFAIRSARRKKKTTPFSPIDRERACISSDVKAASPVIAPEYRFARHLRHPPLPVAHTRDERTVTEENRTMILHD